MVSRDGWLACRLLELVPPPSTRGRNDVVSIFPSCSVRLDTDSLLLVWFRLLLAMTSLNGKALEIFSVVGGIRGKLLLASSIGFALLEGSCVGSLAFDGIDRLELMLLRLP